MMASSFTAESLPDLSGSYCSNLSFRSCRSPTCSSTRNIRAKYLEQLQSFMTEVGECSSHITAGDMENNVSTLWNDLKQENKLPLGGALMNSCEQELQELVRQIEIMVKSREYQLRQKTKKTQKQLESKTKECLQQKTTLDENFKKIITLHRQLDNSEKERQNVMHMYESQLTDLKDEASRLRKEHEHLHKKYQRKMHEMDKQGRTVSEMDLEKNNEIKQLTNQIKECEAEKKELEFQTKELHSKNNLLDSKYKELCDKFQIQQQLLESKEQIFKSEKDFLEEKLTSLMGTISTKEACIKKMQGAMELLSNYQNQIVEENKRLLQNQKVTNSNSRSLDTEVKKLEQQREKDHQEIQNLQDQILKKDEELIDFSNEEKLLKEAICALKLDLDAKNQRIFQLEQQLTGNSKGKSNEELQNKQLTNGQLDSLRSENHLLRQALIQQKDTKTEKSKEDFLKIQNENLALQKSVDDLTSQLSKCNIEFRQKVQNVMKIAEQAVNDIKSKHNTKIQKVTEESEKKLQIQQNERQLSEQLAEEQIKALKKRISNLEEELSQEKENNKKVEEEADVLSQLTKEVDNIVQQSALTSANKTSSQIGTGSLLSIEKVKFKEYLLEEENCRKEWEDSFDKNLQQIWLKTEATLQQFIENT